MSYASAQEDALRAENARLVDLLAGTSQRFPSAWRLSPAEEAIMRILLSHDVATAAVVVEVAKTTLPAARVHVHRLRAKISPHGVEIETLYGKGWRLTGREQWRAILATNKEGVQ